MVWRGGCECYVAVCMTLDSHLHLLNLEVLASPSLSAFSLISSFLILAPKNASLSLGNLIHHHRFSHDLLREEYAGSKLISGLSLKHQTLTSN